MTQVDFNYKGTNIIIQCTPNEKFKKIIDIYIIKSGIKEKDLYFIYNGTILNENLTYNELANESDKNRKMMSVLVYKKEDEEQSKESLKKSEYIICPVCKESAKININDYMIDIFGCKNGHKYNKLSIKNYEKTQYYNEVEIKCDICKKVNKSISFKNIFYICLECKKNLCPICKEIHDKSHNIINYEDKFFTCELHYEQYYSYCVDCKKDICMTCQIDHEGHKINYYIAPNIKKIKEEGNNLNNRKEELKNEIKNIIIKLNDFMAMIDNYYSIYNDIINSYGNKRRNYLLLQNIDDITKFTNYFIKDINQIINEKKTINKIIDIFQLYDKMNFTNVINIKYNTNNITGINFNSGNNKNIKINNIKYFKKVKSTDKNETKAEIKDKKAKEIKKEEENSLFIIEKNNEIENYKNLDVSKLKNKFSLQINIPVVSKLFVLKDGRIIGYNNEKFKNFIYDLKNNIIIDLDLKNIDEIIQMDDGIVIIRIGKTIKLIEIGLKNILILQSFDLEKKIMKFFKLSSQSVLFIGKEDKTVYSYETKKLKYQKQKKVGLYYFVPKNIDIINEKELVIFFNDYYKNYIGFYDMENDKLIVKFECFENNVVSGLVNENLFIYGNQNRIYSFYLENHKRGKEFTLGCVPKDIEIYSIFPLNKKQFIIAQYGCINQFEINENKEFKYIHSIILRNYCFSKYLNNRFIFLDYQKDKNSIIIYIYGQK